MQLLHWIRPDTSLQRVTVRLELNTAKKNEHEHVTMSCQTNAQRCFAYNNKQVCNFLCLKQSFRDTATVHVQCVHLE